MKNKELQFLLQGIESCSELKGIKFAYSLAKNKKAIEKEMDALQEAIAPSKEFAEYDKKRIELCNQHAEKDETGKAKMEVVGYSIVGGQKKEESEFVFTEENRKIFRKELEVLRKEYKEVMAARDKQIEEFNKFLEKENDFKPYVIAYKDIPEDITSGMMNSIIELVGEPVKEEEI